MSAKRFSIAHLIAGFGFESLHRNRVSGLALEQSREETASAKGDGLVTEASQQREKVTAAACEHEQMPDKMRVAQARVGKKYKAGRGEHHADRRRQHVR